MACCIAVPQELRSSRPYRSYNNRYAAILD